MSEFLMPQFVENASIDLHSYGLTRLADRAHPTGPLVYQSAEARDGCADRLALEARVRTAEQTAERAVVGNKRKDEFLAHVSHEIRTPMSAIIGLTQLLLDSSLDEDQRQSLMTVKSATQSLVGMIDELLDFSKIEAGKLELDSTTFSIRRTINDVVRLLSATAVRKGINLTARIEPGVPEIVLGDAMRLRQVLMNLASNAIKFTESGHVIVRVDARQPVHEGVSRFSFSVSDTGIGIAREKLATIFNAFEQATQSTSRRYGGTGLGLNIAAKLVALMGGGIEVTSELRQGSTFAFTADFVLPKDHRQRTDSAGPIAWGRCDGIADRSVGDNDDHDNR